ncbi:MAG: phytanoyl-CoA dioxygenase family protein [Gammaproteobacteria bacterium]|nr:phytanoyl-CoA dioxygenase family protein [Gammaproteobacteria bacterium]MDE0444186.1 phytanoyl-CoA dioxygenase family protein [Gammaproteobacteria bacterium]
MLASTEPRTNADEYNPRVITVARPEHHFSYLTDANGDWLATTDGKTLGVQGHVDDAAIWDVSDNGFKHVATDLSLQSDTTTLDAATGLRLNESPVAADGSWGNGESPGTFHIGHGPEKLPSEYLEMLDRQGWVALACILPPRVVDGLQRVGCVDAYAEREPVRQAPLAQDPAVAKVSVEPVSLWLTREYMHTRDIRLGHSPGVSALTRDDGKREVQGWHNDFPYLWGTGDRIPVPSGDLVLGMQRNVCVSDFTKENGATLFKLGSHASNKPPPREWGISTHTYRRGHRAEFGLPYAGPDADVIEAPAGTIVLYDARTWHRAGMNQTDEKRGAIIQALIPGFIVPFMDTSGTYKAFLESDACQQVTERERKEVEKLMVHKIVGPGGLFAIGIDKELTERVRQQAATARSVY